MNKTPPFAFSITFLTFKAVCPWYPAIKSVLETSVKCPLDKSPNW